MSSVTGISDSNNPYTNGIQGSSSFQKGRADFQQLEQALSSGSLGDAQQALATLQSDLPNIPSNSPLAQTLSAVGQALQSGDVSSAQQALQGWQQAHGAHHHHHHHQQTQGAGASTTSTTGSSSPGVGTVVNASA